MDQLRTNVSEARTWTAMQFTFEDHLDLPTPTIAIPCPIDFSQEKVIYQSTPRTQANSGSRMIWMHVVIKTGCSLRSNLPSKPDDDFEYMYVVTFNLFCGTLRDTSCMDNHLLPNKSRRARVLRNGVVVESFLARNPLWVIRFTFCKTRHLYKCTTSTKDKACASSRRY